MKVNEISAFSAVSAGTRRTRLLLAAGLLALTGCDRTPPLFELLPAEVTGVTFVNELPEAPEINIINYLNYYNGGGVAAGDVDGDGLPDLYFTSNLGPDRLYRNKGDFRFEDITEGAGVGGAQGAQGERDDSQPVPGTRGK